MLLRIAPLWILTTMLAVGCGSPDSRYADLAEQVVAEQSQQNAQVAKQTRQIAEASRQLVEADADARREIITAHERLQSNVGQQRIIVDQQREALESERRELATERHRAPVVAGAITGAGLLIAMVLPLIVCIYLVRYLATSPEPAVEMVQILANEIVAEEPRRLPSDDEATARRLTG